jgi:tRNA threonylcarbamoyl adenosine modification protein YeaZ
MLILALDTSLDACSVALYDSAGASMLAYETEVIGKGHAERLMAMMTAVMAEAGVAFSAVARIGVTVGPGSFTGIRVGLAAARGLSLASGIPVVGISTLDAIAPDAPGDEPALVVLDARRGEVYAALYDRSRRLVSPPALLTLADAATVAIAAQAGLFGSGAPLVSATQSPATLPISGLKAYPDIFHVAVLAADAAAPSEPPKPLYLRAPDAKPQTRGVVERAGGMT